MNVGRVNLNWNLKHGSKQRAVLPVERQRGYPL